MGVEDQIRARGLEIPPLPEPQGSYFPGVKVANLLFTSGTGSLLYGRRHFLGKVDQDITIQEGQESAKIAVLNNLAIVKAIVGSLDAIRMIQIIGYVNSSFGFKQQSMVINGASVFLLDVLGEKGRHARTDVGVAGLPFGISVEIDMVVEIL